MARQLSAKRRFEANWKALWKIHDAPTNSSSTLSEEEASSKTVKQLVWEFGRPVRTAFKKARLDIRNDYHWKILLLTLARAVYSNKGPGKPKTWSNKKLRRLLKDVAEMKTKYPHDAELECCERLIEESPDHHYNDVDNAKTLRRVLQAAKRLHKDAQLVARVRDCAVPPVDLSNILKKGL
jgi:hypothetical protein